MRPRKTDKHLPSCVYERSGAFYYVKQNKWTLIGRSLPEALKAYAKIIDAPTDKMPALLDRYLKDIDVAPNTLKLYKSAVKKLSEIFAEFEPVQVTARDMMTVMHKLKSTPGMANIMRVVMIGAMDLAFIEQYVDRNVIRDTKKLPMAKRDRYITDAEFAAIYRIAPPTTQVIMDLCYLTGQRISDVLNIRYSDLTEHGIEIVQQKTKHRMLIAWSEDLLKVVDRAKKLHASVKGMTLLHTRAGNTIPYGTVVSAWKLACGKAKVENAHIHDIRAKAATDSNADGLDSKTLLGHQSESVHNRYLRSKETPVVKALSFRQSNIKAS